MSPELFDPEIKDHRRTRYSDCYALGMVIYEVLSRRKPFNRDSDLVVVVKVGNGDRPKKPQGVAWFTDDVWEVLKLCWAPQPKERPSIEDVLRCLEEVSRSWTLPPLPSVAVPSTADLSTSTASDISGEHSMDVDESRIPSLSQPSDRLPPKGNAVENDTHPLTHQFPGIFYEALDHEDLGAEVNKHIGPSASSPSPRYESSQPQATPMVTLPPQTQDKCPIRDDWAMLPQIEFGRVKSTDATDPPYPGVPGYGDEALNYEGVESSTLCRLNVRLTSQAPQTYQFTPSSDCKIPLTQLAYDTAEDLRSPAEAGVFQTAGIHFLQREWPPGPEHGRCPAQ